MKLRSDLFKNLSKIDLSPLDEYFKYTIYRHNRFTITPLKSNCNTTEPRPLEMKTFSNKPAIRVSLKFVDAAADADDDVEFQQPC